MTNSDFRNTDTEELKKKGNFASDYDIDCKRHYRFCLLYTSPSPRD